MGAGKSKSYLLTIGGSESESYTDNLSDEEYSSFENFMYSDLENYKGDDIDSDILDMLQKEGVTVSLGSGYEEAGKVIKELGGNIEVKELEPLISKYGSVSKALDAYYNYDEEIPLSKDKIQWLGELSRRELGRIDYPLNNKNNSHIKWAKDNIDEGSYLLTNADLGTLLRLTKITKELGVSGISNLSFDTNMKDIFGRTPAGFYEYSKNGSSIRINSKLLLEYRNTNKQTTNFNVTGYFPQSIISHEFGHHIYKVVFGESNNIKGNSAVSSYGNYNHMEAFAEAFSSYCLGVNPKQGKEYYSNFKKIMKDKGLSKFEGCLRQSFSKTKTNTISKTNNTSKTNNFINTSKSISGSINGKSFSAKITEGIKKRGYIERTIDGTKYRIDINTGNFTKV